MPCPKPLLLKLHLVLMEFIGKNGKAAPRSLSLARSLALSLSLSLSLYGLTLRRGRLRDAPLTQDKMHQARHQCFLFVVFFFEVKMQQGVVRALFFLL